MSRPWQFSEDRASSPFDRPQNNTPAQPVSYKTNVNRTKTKKWTEAKNLNYDGDDWGGYDPYDEYGSYDDHPQAQAPAHAMGHRGSFEAGDERRAFSAGAPPQTPQHHPPQHVQQHQARPDTRSQNNPASQDYAIRRDFSQPAHVPPPLHTRASPSPVRTTAESPAARFPPRKSSLSSSLQGSPAPISQQPVDTPASPSPQPPVASGTSKPLPFVRPSDIYRRMQEEREKERSSLDTSRPSLDSLSREASRERTSTDGISRATDRRPSMEPVPESNTAPRSSLEPLPERKLERGYHGFTVSDPALAMAIGAAVAKAPAQGSPPQTSEHGSPNAPTVEATSAAATPASALPQVSRVASGFGTDFWGASGLTEDSDHQSASPPTGSAASFVVPSSSRYLSESEPKELQHQPSLGFRSIVHQAFDAPNDDVSVPPTPISRDSSQRGSETSGISPILSRAPSEATAEARVHTVASRDATIPPIAEENSQPTSPGSRPVSAAALSNPSPAHSRNISGEAVPSSFVPGYRRNLETPSPGNSPSRSPELEYTKRLSTGMTAEARTIANVSTLDGGAGEGHRNITAVKIPHADYTKRESDLADKVSSSPDKDFAGAAQAARVARSQFLETHSPTLVSSPTFPKPSSRATSPMPGRESPGPSRVREMAGKYNELHDLSRTNSGLSLDSRKSQNSLASWERSDENLSLEKTPTSGSDRNDGFDSPQHITTESEQAHSRPDTNRGPSFRPHLPGEWVSYMETPATERPEVPLEMTPTPKKTGFSESADTVMRSPDTPRGSVQPSIEVPDFTPSANRRTTSPSGPVDAVKAAGDALGAALMASIGMGHKVADSDSEQLDGSSESPDEGSSATKTSLPRHAAGDVYLRPFAMTGVPTSAGSSVAPTPPPKDTPKIEVERSSGYFPHPVVRIDSDAPSVQFTADSPYDMESDRLRREIERSLTPQVVSENEEQAVTPEAAPNIRDGLRTSQATGTTSAVEMPANRSDLDKSHSNYADPKTREIVPNHTISDSRPALIDQRFSWEQRPQASTDLFGPAGSQTEPSASYERPLSTGALHVVNTNISSESEPTSPVQEAQLPIPAYSTDASAPAETGGIDAVDTSTALPPSSPEASRHSREIETPRAQPAPGLQIDDAGKVTSGSAAEQALSSNTTESARVPPFREILALKSASERISSYNSTRDQFATMDTGLQSWLSSTISSNPQHSDIASGGALRLTNSNVIGSVRHRGGPSLMKIANKIGSSNKDAASTADTDIATAALGAERKPSVSHSSGTEKMQTKGKELFHSFGGKASVGAKGLFAKAKGRLRESGGEKAPERQLQNTAGARTTPGTTAILAPTVAAADRPASIESLEAVPTGMPDRSRGKDARPPSRSSNRFSAAFTRMRSGSRGDSRSRPSSMVLHQPDQSGDPTGKEMKRRSTPLPLMVDDKDAAIAPWNIQREEDIIETQEQRKQRIGVLPSPALDGSWALTPQASPAKQSLSKMDIEDEFYRATPLEKGSPGGETRPNVEPGTRIELPARGGTTHNEFREDPGSPFPAVSDDSSAPKMASSKERSSNRQEHIHTSFGPTPTRRSSVSSIGSGDANDMVASAIERTVSPVEYTSQSLRLVPSRPKNADSSFSEKSRDLSMTLSGKQRNLDSSQRPKDSRKTSRSSLPSQQRPQEQRQPSWNPISSTMSPLDLIAGDGDARLDSPTVPGRVLALHDRTDLGNETRSASPHYESTAQQWHDQTAAINPEGAEEASGPHHPGQSLVAAVGDIPIRLTASSREQSRRSSRSWLEDESLSAAYIRPPHFERDDIQCSIPSQKATTQDTRDQPRMLSYTAAHQEGTYDRTFGPAVIDPRQQEAEYQLPGIGPPQEIHRTGRGIGVFRSGAMQNQQPEAERISPNSTQLYQRTFSGDIVPRVQSRDGQKEKRRSSIFAAFSRSSSVSDGRPSQGNATSSNASQQTKLLQHQNPALIAAQTAQENSGKGNVLKKIQRSSTSASSAIPDPDKKQNRFSRLGSIFRRTNSEARKGNKLVKAMPKSETQVSTPPGSMANRTAYQGMQQSYASLPQLPVAQHETQGLEDATYIPRENVPAPPGGWFAPSSRRSSYTSEQQPTLPQIQPSPQQSTRRLHSEGFRKYSNTTPEALRSLESPYRQAPPTSDRQRLGPQYEQTVPPQSAYHHPSSHVLPGMQPRSSNNYGPQRPAGATPTRNFSYGSGLSQSSQPELQTNQYQPDYHVHGQGSAYYEPRHTPTHSRNSSGAFGAQNYRMSITDEDLEMMGPPRRQENTLQQASSPALYGATQAYQVPALPDTYPTTSSLYARRASPSWYSANYTHQPGPAQQASTPSMYYAGPAGGPQLPPKTPLGGSRVGSRANSMTGSRPNSIIEGQVYQVPTVTGSYGYSPVRHPVMPQERYYGAPLPMMENAAPNW